MLNLQVAIIADTTGSMSPCIREVRHEIENFCSKLREDRKINAHFAVITHGDYCDGHKVITSLDFTQDWKKLQSFIRNSPNTYGGDSAECYEYALYSARTALSWVPEYEKIIVMFGDDKPHPVSYPGNFLKLNWIKEATELGKAGVKIYAVQCLDNSYAEPFWGALGRYTKGYHLRLQNFGDVLQMIGAVVANEGHYLQEYAEELQKSFKFNRGLATAFETLSKGKLSFHLKSSVAGLEPVSPYRFQSLKVGRVKTRIDEFVKASGAEFKRGRGFYEFTKTETIQEKKEVVLVDRATGDKFTGPEARNLIGLPYGERGRLAPVILDKFKVFVQSTSNNRALMPNTEFLYEVA